MMKDDDINDNKSSTEIDPSKKEKAAGSQRPIRPLWQKMMVVALVLLVVAAVVSIAVTTTMSEASVVSESNLDKIVPTQTPSNIPSDIPSESSIPSPSPSDTPSQSLHPSTSPSNLPSTSPSNLPSTSPSTSPPSTSPSKSPTYSPSTSPTISPTNAPTSEDVEPNPVPSNPGRGYFNYDINDSQYGPTRWNRVDTRDHPLREFGPNGFGAWAGHLSYDPSDNMCGGPDRRQSPKNMVGTIACEAHHEIRTWCGDYEIGNDNYVKQILPHKLSMVMNRRQCIDLDQERCQSPEPPIADYPRYSSAVTAYSDLLNYDIKIPGEHTIEGESFDAEIQMLHSHPTNSRVSSIGVMVRVEENGYNAEFQKIIDEFQNLYDDHAKTCANRRKARNLRFWNDTDIGELFSSKQQRQNTQKFNPYADALMPSIFFYRYDGSITEPPCKDITWWVMIDPMIISEGQLREIQQILFTHVDENCDRTSVHNGDQSVARPIFPLGNNRDIQRCSKGIFISDLDKGRGEGKKCR